MVDTMALLPPFVRSSRTPRTRRSVVQHLAVVLPADDEVLLDAPDDRLAPALVAAGQGTWQTASTLLTATRASAAWEHRDRYVVRLAAFAGARPEWFEDWRRAAPHDPDMLLVAAQRAVARAWESPARAELLRELNPLITAAARGDDRDPVPWRLALDHAHGSNAGHKYFEELWEAAIRRAPHHYGCHAAALRYLADSWHGSHHECFDFAETAAQDAPADSLVQALPTRAAFAYLTDGCGPDIPVERLSAAADRAIALSARFPAADPWPAKLRNKLAYVLSRLHRWPDALEQMRLIGPYATSFPWEQLSDDPLGCFLELREEIRLHAASGHPPGGHSGRALSGDH
ncbi:hypothetical protein [Streptomyces sp. S.PB5]|uniref:hypothetical protein n=1 Tax=Streptomyces sp. S.PB5 TaxID=3020844 RepID=UPI0025B111A3|nr:hypothetical protein [Streptomyces sp. S.PB5]MDN3020878.1 hypothetical protein [Streptomyces sp. S.PB5]